EADKVSGVRLSRRGEREGCGGQGGQTVQYRARSSDTLSRLRIDVDRVEVPGETVEGSLGGEGLQGDLLWFPSVRFGFTPRPPVSAKSAETGREERPGTSEVVTFDNDLKNRGLTLIPYVSHTRAEID